MKVIVAAMVAWTAGRMASAMLAPEIAVGSAPDLTTSSAATQISILDSSANMGTSLRGEIAEDRVDANPLLDLATNC